MLSRLLLTALTILITTSAASAPAKSGDFILPADILFTTSDTGSKRQVLTAPQNILARVDAESWDVDVFYQDEDAWLVRALDWSSDAQRLVIYQELTPEDGTSYAEICILNRVGKELVCLEDHPPLPWNAPYVTWSDNGQFIYFVAEIDGEKKLVEANIETGQTTRVIYDPPLEDYVFNLFWSPHLDAFGINWTTGLGMTPYLTYEDELIDLETVITAQGSVQTFCPEFSPSNGYISIVIRYGEWEAGTDLVILNRDGSLFQEIHIDNAISCPVWQPDDAGFFMVENDYFGISEIAVYGGTQFERKVIHRLEDEHYLVQEPLVPFDGYFAGRTGDIRTPEIVIIAPDGKYEIVAYPYFVARYPVWMPEQ